MQKNRQVRPIHIPIGHLVKGNLLMPYNDCIIDKVSISLNANHSRIVFDSRLMKNMWVCNNIFGFKLSSLVQGIVYAMFNSLDNNTPSGGYVIIIANHNFDTSILGNFTAITQQNFRQMSIGVLFDGLSMLDMTNKSVRITNSLERNSGVQSIVSSDDEVMNDIMKEIQSNISLAKRKISVIGQEQESFYKKRKIGSKDASILMYST